LVQFFGNVQIDPNQIAYNFLFSLDVFLIKK